MNLKLHLLIRMSLMGLLCWLGVSIYLVSQSGRHAAHDLESSADQLQPIVAAEVMRRWISLDSDARFPDLGSAAGRFPAPMCLRYSARDGSSSAFGCGESPARATVPPFVTWILNALGPGGTSSAREITVYGQSVGTLQVEADEANLLERQWRSVRELLGLTAVTVLVLDLLVFWVIGRALRPAARIVVAVEQLGESVLTKPLPLFRPREFALIANGINSLADRLRRSYAARAELTTRLIRVQEDERRELTHELHEEFGQCVAALGAVSASVRQSVLARELLTEADVMPLELGVEQMLLSLRGMLQRMSLPSLQQQGLRSALVDLITAWHSRFHVGLRLILDADEAADPIPGYDCSLCVYRAVQECLSNIARHAPATGEAHVCLRYHSDGLRLRVSNELAEMSQGQNHAGTGMGLKLLSERVRALGGDCSAKATATQFIVEVHLPMISQ